MNTISTDKNTSKPYFKNLYGLRFIAAMAVLIFHGFSLYRETWSDIYQSTTYQILLKIVDKGSLGVNLFFVLSGFLITYLLLWEKNAFGKINVLAFVKRRSLRIWPLYFALVLFCFFLFPLLPFAKEYVYSFEYYAFFLPNINEIQVGANDGLNFFTPFWSVGVEEQFYMILATLIALFSFKKEDQFLYLYLLVILASLIFRFINLDNERTMYYHSFSVMGDIATGGLLALACYKNIIQRKIQNLSKKSILLIYFIIFTSILFKNQLFPGVLMVFQRQFLALGFAFIIVEQIYAHHSFFLADKNKWVKKGGEISYGIYLFHAIVMYYISSIFGHFGFQGNWLHLGVYLLLVIFVSISLAYLSYHYYEKKFLKLK